MHVMRIVYYIVKNDINLLPKSALFSDFFCLVFVSIVFRHDFATCTNYNNSFQRD